jgi:hypothetical protein
MTYDHLHYLYTFLFSYSVDYTIDNPAIKIDLEKKESINCIAVRLTSSECSTRESYFYISIFDTFQQAISKLKENLDFLNLN